MMPPASPIALISLSRPAPRKSRAAPASRSPRASPPDRLDQVSPRAGCTVGAGKISFAAAGQRASRRCQVRQRVGAVVGDEDAIARQSIAGCSRSASVNFPGRIVKRQRKPRGVPGTPMPSAGIAGICDVGLAVRSRKIPGVVAPRGFPIVDRDVLLTLH